MSISNSPDSTQGGPQVFTPGPWKVRRLTEWTPDNGAELAIDAEGWSNLATVYEHCSEDIIKDMCGAANARLIAAAPELRESAYVLMMLAMQSDRYAKDEEYRQAVDDVYAAIKKADGR